MNCFEQLGLQADASLGQVKKAYAEKLKTTRPDENPEGFQKLHAAYKQASCLVKNAQTEPKDSMNEADFDEQTHVNQIKSVDDKNPAPEALENEKQNTDKLSDSSPEVDEETLQQNAQIDEAIERIWSKCEELLNNSQEKIYLKNWQFLQQEPLILNPQVEYRLGFLVFEKVSNQIREFRNKINTQRINSQNVEFDARPFTNELIAFFNLTFSWREYIWSFDEQIDDELCDIMWQVIESLPPIEDERQANIIRNANNISQSTKTYNDIDLQNLAGLKLYCTVVCIVSGLQIMFAAFALREMMMISPISVAIFSWAMLALLWLYVQKNKSFAIFIFTLICFLSLFKFPVGTIIGAIGLVKVYQSRKVIGIENL